MSIDYRRIGDRRTVPKVWLTPGCVKALLSSHHTPRSQGSEGLGPLKGADIMGGRTGPRVSWLKLPPS